MAKKGSTKDEQAEDGAKKPRGKRKLLVIVLLVVVVAVGGFGYMTMSKHPASASDKGGPTTTAGGPITEEASLTVNLSDSHYLQFTVAIQTVPGKSDKVLTKDQPIVLDILNSRAEAMTETELLAPQGPARLKAAIVASLNHEWPGLVQAIYFEQFVMQ
ncbi:MAG: flagellar basal body-associated FliL family protein [Acidimicrobiales bacterium]